MRVADLNWMQLEAYLESDDRIVLPLGSIEQHGYLSLGVDTILAERVSVEAAEPLGVPVLPSLPFGLAPYFAGISRAARRCGRDLPGGRARPARLALRAGLQALRARQRARRQRAGAPRRRGVAARSTRAQALWHNWWNGPRTKAVVDSIDRDASHGSWMENFPWTRLAGVVQPEGGSRWPTSRTLRESDPADVRALLGDGTLGGLYVRPDDDMLPGLAGRRRRGPRAARRRVAVVSPGLGGRVAVVTGTAHGIGAAIARALEERRGHRARRRQGRPST